MRSGSAEAAACDRSGPPSARLSAPPLVRAFGSRASGPDVRLLAEREFQDSQGEEGALEPDGAQGNPEGLEDRIPVDGLRFGHRLALDDRREHRRARLANRAALSFEPHIRNPAGSVDFQAEDHLVPAQRVRVPGLHACARQATLVPRMLVVVQDLLLVQVARGGHQAKTSWTFRMPAMRASTSSRSLYT